jgi:hypothetical protein
MQTYGAAAPDASAEAADACLQRGSAAARPEPELAGHVGAWTDPCRRQ